MDFSFPLSVVTPTLDGPVLAVLALVDERFTVGQLHRMLGRSEEGIRRVVVRLVEQGIVLRDEVGASHAYRLNRDHLAAEAIRTLADQRGILLSRLEGEFSRWSPPPAWAAVFGSISGGGGGLGSDLDLLIVHEGDSSGLDVAVADLSTDVSGWTGNDARPLVYSMDEVRAVPGEPVLVDALAHGLTVAGDRARVQRLVTPPQRTHD